MNIFTAIFRDPMAGVDAVGVQLEDARRRLMAARAAGDQAGIDAALAEMQRLSGVSASIADAAGNVVAAGDAVGMLGYGAESFGGWLANTGERVTAAAGRIVGAPVGAVVDASGLSSAGFGLLLMAGAGLFVFSRLKK